PFDIGRLLAGCRSEPVSQDLARIDLDYAVQCHYGELIGKIRNRVEFMQIVSQKFLKFGRQVIGTALDRTPFRGSSIVDVCSETVDCLHLACREPAQVGAHSKFRNPAFSCHDLPTWMKTSLPKAMSSPASGR